MLNKLAKNILNIPKSKKEKFKHDEASTIYLQIVGSGAYGAPRSLYIFTEHCRYFFNCGEGTQRLASEHKVKLGMTEHVLITHKTWENVGGLPGALLTLQDTGVPRIMIHGPPGVDSLYNDTKNFMRFSDLQISYHHYEKDEGLFEEGPLTIQAVPLWPEATAANQGTRQMSGEESKQEVQFGNLVNADETAKTLEMEEDMFAHEKMESSKSSSNSTTENPNLQKQKLEESIRCRDLALAYICKPVPKAPKLLLLAPKGIVHYLSSYDANFESICDQFTIIPNHCLVDSEDLDEKTMETYKSSVGVRDIKCCFVHHCPNAFGVAVTLESGWKLVYSGDTRPCQSLVDIGLDCDVLIHEATMEDDLREDARLKRHSTTSEALGVAAAMRAAHVLLTHFSQRYAKVPLLDGGHVPDNVGVAFDNMMVHLRDLPILSHLYPAFVSTFAEEVDEMRRKRERARARRGDQEKAQ